MKPKIIVADDSQTIQKVIKITLASEDYELVECLDYAELESQVSHHHPDIILLDFNFSENKTGYDIAREIKDTHQDVKFMMLYGTFDTVEEDLLELSGVSNHIVKPFDGTKFINYCRQLANDIELEEEAESEEEIETTFDEDTEIPSVIEDEEESDSDEQWVVNQPTIDDEDEIVEEKPMSFDVKELNSLEQDMQDWGMEIPGVIGENDTSGGQELPPIISSDAHETQFVVEGSMLPSDDDLDFPDAGALIEKVKAEEIERPAPQLVPVTELNSTNENEDNLNEFDFDRVEVGASSEEEVSNIESQIADEADDDDLWQADEVYESKIESDKEESPEVTNIEPIKPHSLEEVIDHSSYDEVSMDELDDKDVSAKVNLDDIPTDFPTDVMEEPSEVTHYAESFNEKDLESKIEQMVGPIIEKVVKEAIERQLKESANKVAWEVIPDLAENLIKKELKTISSKILNTNH